MLSLGRRGGQRRADPGAQSGARHARPFLWVLFLFSIRHVQNIRVVQIQKDLTFGLCTLSILLHIQQATRPCAAVAGAADALEKFASSSVWKGVNLTLERAVRVRFHPQSST